MKIAILGPGCVKCRQTADIVREAVARTGVDAEIAKIEDIGEIVKYGVLSTPAVAIDGTVRIAGRIPTVQAVAALLEAEQAKTK